jgi:hypothetical protein
MMARATITYDDAPMLEGYTGRYHAVFDDGQEQDRPAVLGPISTTVESFNIAGMFGKWEHVRRDGDVIHASRRDL